MKVVLRNPYASDGQHFSSLTVGREYEVLGIEADYYRLLDDGAEPVLFEPSCFEVVQPDEPPFWANELGEDGERYAYPPGWGVPGFFEAWHDGSTLVRDVFAEQLAHWYPAVRRAD